MEALIPQTVDGFLAAEKNISQTRLVGGATRLQPITMMTGQAVGALAALAVRRGVPPRLVKPEDVQRVLVQAGAVISGPSYRDMPPAGTPSWKAIQLVTARGLMTGYANGAFGANDPLTRVQAAIAVGHRFGLKNSAGTYSFVDVPAGSPGADEIEALYQ